MRQKRPEACDGRRRTRPEKRRKAAMKMKESQFLLIKEQLKKLTSQECFYQKKLEGIDVDQIKSQEDFEKLPFTWKGDLREAYPLGLMAVPEEEIVRIHSSSGTTGIPVIIPYTRQDVEDWAEMFKRCYEMAGITNMDRIQITPGYGLWTAGIGFQNGAERLGAMVVPMGPGNTDKQLRMMMDMKSTVLCATSSYALLLAEEIEKRGIKDRIHLNRAVIGSERWGDKMRKRIANELGVKLFDIYGLTEVYGPGIAINCEKQGAMHYWDDYIYLEIVDPKTGEVLPDGEVGEIVITTLRKQGAPLIRYRTHDLSRIVPGDCPCGSPYPRIDTLIGRTDDMVKVKGVNIFPSQIEEMLAAIDGASSEYQVMVDHLLGKDVLTLFVEVQPGVNKYGLEIEIQDQFKYKIGLTPVVKLVEIGELPRSEKKSTRVFDNRY
ncbi:MAG: phenylacetate--CoA ligase [Lachnospiraceae bacterium]|nr:phenylacetate--CoA ligase [Lachnospiraceae bacterium]